MKKNLFSFKQRMHPKDYERFLAMKEEEKSQMYHDRNEYQASKSKFDQKDFDRIVMNFMISGMQPPSLLEDPSFSTLLNGKYQNLIFDTFLFCLLFGDLFAEQFLFFFFSFVCSSVARTQYIVLFHYEYSNFEYLYMFFKQYSSYYICFFIPRHRIKTNVRRAFIKTLSNYLTAGVGIRN